jgi:hypothetical protein
VEFLSYLEICVPNTDTRSTRCCMGDSQGTLCIELIFSFSLLFPIFLPSSIQELFLWIQSFVHRSLNMKIWIALSPFRYVPNWPH